MSSFQITAIHLVKPLGASHGHIDAVKLEYSNTELSRATVVNDIRNNIDNYYTHAKGKYAEVIVTACPHCNNHCARQCNRKQSPVST